MNVGSVRRIHQAHDGMVDMAVEIHGLNDHRRATDDARQDGRLMIGRSRAAGIGGDINPDDALLFADRVVADLDTLDIHRLVRRQRRHRGTGAGRIEGPAMIGALHDAALFRAHHLTGRQGCCAVRADIADGVGLAIEVTAEQDRFAENDVTLQLAGLEIAGQGREPPAILEQALTEDDTGGRGQGALIGHIHVSRFWRLRLAKRLA